MADEKLNTGQEENSQPSFVATYELIQMLLEKNNMHDDVCCKRCISSASNTTYSQLICGRMK